MIYIRFSREDDKDNIEELLNICFGKRTCCGVYDNLIGRYLLAFDNNILVGMSGLIYVEEYKGYEIDWTCTRPEYRKQGIMHELFNRLCSLTDEDIYCSCWRPPHKDKINLYSLMRDFGFVEVMRPRVAWDSKYNCKCCRSRKGNCVEQKYYIENGKEIIEECKCYEDLYLRK